MKRRGGPGNSSQIVMALDGRPDPDRLREGLRSFLGRFPVASGTVARSWLNLAPYWRMPRALPGPVLRVGRAAGDSAETAAELARCAARKFPSEDVHMAFHLTEGGPGQSHFAMTFDHRLLDARGAELFLEGLRRHLGGDPDGLRAGARADEAPSGLTGWRDRFRSGRTVNRKLLSLLRSDPRRAPGGDRSGPARTGFRLLHLDESAAAGVLDRAEREAGTLMEVAYLLAAAVTAVHALCEARRVAGANYVVPVTVDVRPPDDAEEAVFFNYSSFFFFQLAASLAGDRGGTVAEVKRQMYAQVQDRFPHRLAEAMYLARIAPRGVLGRLFSRFLGAGPASFSFAYLGRSALGAGEFMGAPVRNVFHMPLVPAPPGLGIFLNRWKGRLNATISFDGTAFGEAEMDRLAGDLEKRL